MGTNHARSGKQKRKLSGLKTIPVRFELADLKILLKFRADNWPNGDFPDFQAVTTIFITHALCIPEAVLAEATRFTNYTQQEGISHGALMARVLHGFVKRSAKRYTAKPAPKPKADPNSDNFVDDEPDSADWWKGGGK